LVEAEEMGIKVMRSEKKKWIITRKQAINIMISILKKK
jgi:hypothetical protein